MLVVRNGGGSPQFKDYLIKMVRAERKVGELLGKFIEFSRRPVKRSIEAVAWVKK